MMRASLKLKSVDLASAEEEEDLMVSKGKERAMKLTSLHTLPHGKFIVWACEYVSYRPRLGQPIVLLHSTIVRFGLLYNAP